jgi:hypothetical protein
MKQGTNSTGFPPKPWTVKVREVDWSPDGGRINHYVATNLVTGEEKSPRLTYGRALDDIPESTNAEPWGV